MLPLAKRLLASQHLPRAIPCCSGCCPAAANGAAHPTARPVSALAWRVVCHTCVRQHGIETTRRPHRRARASRGLGVVVMVLPKALGSEG